MVAALITIDHSNRHHPLSFLVIHWDWLLREDSLVSFDRLQLSIHLFSFLIAVTPVGADHFSLDGQE